MTTMHHFDLGSYPTTKTLQMLASLLERITSTNDKLNTTPSSSSTSLTKKDSSTSLSYTRFHARSIPSIDISSYLSRILKYCPCANECFLSLLVYFDRMSKNAIPLTGKPFTIDSYNIHRLIIAGIMVSAKYFSDVFFTNSRYAKVGGLPVSELNSLEIEFLLLNNFALSVSIEELQRYGDQLLRHWRAEEDIRRGVSPYHSPQPPTQIASVQSQFPQQLLQKPPPPNPQVQKPSISPPKQTLKQHQHQLSWDHENSDTNEGQIVKRARRLTIEDKEKPQKEASTPPSPARSLQKPNNCVTCAMVYTLLPLPSVNNTPAPLNSAPPIPQSQSQSNPQPNGATSVTSLSSRSAGGSPVTNTTPTPVVKEKGKGTQHPHRISTYPAGAPVYPINPGNSLPSPLHLHGSNPTTPTQASLPKAYEPIQMTRIPHTHSRSGSSSSGIGSGNLSSGGLGSGNLKTSRSMSGLRNVYNNGLEAATNANDSFDSNFIGNGYSKGQRAWYGTDVTDSPSAVPIDMPHQQHTNAFTASDPSLSLNQKKGSYDQRYYEPPPPLPTTSTSTPSARTANRVSITQAKPARQSFVSPSRKLENLLSESPFGAAAATGAAKAHALSNSSPSSSANNNHSYANSSKRVPPPHQQGFAYLPTAPSGADSGDGWNASEVDHRPAPKINQVIKKRTSSSGLRK